MHLHPEDRSSRFAEQALPVAGRRPGRGLAHVRLDWTPDRLEVFVDGVRVWRVHRRQVPDEPMYLVINLAVGGVYPGPPDRSTAFPATYAIDHLRITAA